jgi:C4-dicarboxylate transporter
MGLATSPSSIYLVLPFMICTALYLAAITYFWRSFKDVKLPEEQVLSPIAETVAATT